MLAHKQQIAPDEQIIKCEACENTLQRKHALSFVICYATTGMADERQANPPFQCCDLQHFACCHDHAIQLAIACLQDHHTNEAVYTKHAPLVSGAHEEN